MNTIKMTFGLAVILCLLGCPEDVQNKLEGRKRAREAAAMIQMQRIFSAQQQFKITKNTYGSSLKELAQAKLLSSKFLKGNKVGEYIFTMKITDGGQGFFATGTPSAPIHGTRVFSVDQTGVIK